MRMDLELSEQSQDPNRQRTVELSGGRCPDPSSLPSSEPLQSWIGRTLDQRYRLLRVVGFGASATVFEAEHLGLGRPVAVKVLPHAAASAQTRRRLAREAKILSTIEHPHVVEVLDFGRVDVDADFLVMEYLRGCTLKEAEAHPIVRTWPWIRSAIQQLLAALEAIHARGIVHRDVKPSNCFCVDFDPNAPAPKMKLLDFGISKSEQSSALTATGAVLGTVLYMAPEQARGLEVDARVDLYAIGAVLYQLVTGVLPFSGAGFLDVMWRQVYSEPTPPRDANPKVRIPDALEALILRALHKNPDRRFQSAAEFSAALAAIDGEGIVCAEAPLRPSRDAATPDGDRMPDGSTARPTVTELGASLENSVDERRVLESSAKTWLTALQPIAGYETLVVRQRRTLQPREVDSFWPHRIAGSENAPDSDVPYTASLPAVFADADRSLLVLGGPGYGKSHGLLEIAADLHARASCHLDRVMPLPMLFDLTTWSPSDAPLKELLATQLHREQRVPRATAKRWLLQQRIIPLIDGLDRMPRARQAAAVEAINAFIAEANPPGIAVTCRAQVYRTLPKRLQLRAAVELHEIDVDALTHALASEPRSEPLARAIRTSPQLAGFVRSPLGLRIAASVACTEDGVKRLAAANLQEMRAIYDMYTEQLLRRRRSKVEIETLLASVRELASDMLRHGVASFRLDVLQPGWLQRPFRRGAYLIGSRLLVALLIGASCMLAVGKTPLDNGGLVPTMEFGIRYGIAVALGLAFANIVGAALLHGQDSPLYVRSPHLRWIGTTAVATLVGSALLASWTTFAPLMVLAACALGSAVFWFGQGGTLEREDITLTDDLHWSLAQLRRRAPWVALATLTMFAFTGLTESLVQGAVNGSVATIFGVGIGGTRRVTAAPHDASSSAGDDAIARMRHRAWLAGGLAFVATALIFSPLHGPLYAAYAALPVAVTIALWFGGLAGIYHRVLYLLLRGERRYLRDDDLLETAAAVGLLDKRPSGIRFFHPSYAEYFAARTGIPADASEKLPRIAHALRILLHMHPPKSS